MAHKIKIKTQDLQEALLDFLGKKDKKAAAPKPAADKKPTGPSTNPKFQYGDESEEEVKDMYARVGIKKEGQLDEAGVDVGAVVAGMAAIGATPILVNKFWQYIKKKNPEAYRKAQALGSAMDQKVGGNRPGQGHGVDPRQTFGPNEGELNEISSESIAALVGLIPGVVLTAALVKDIISYMKSKGLKGIDGFKQAYKAVGGEAAKYMDRKVGGNQPGEKAGQVNPNKTFGPNE